MNSPSAAALAGSLVLAAFSWSQTNESSSIPRINFEHYKLPNGLRVILHLNRSAPVVHLNLQYHVGAKQERPGRTGFAHLFEHMLGQGVDPTADYGVLADRIGATDVSGSVAHDYTEFFETVPSHRLERMLWLESNRLVKLPEALTQQNFDKQREIVRNERRQKVENRPYGRINMLIHRHGFPEGHPYAHDAIGSHEDLEAATLEEVRQFYRAYYTPDNLTLVLAGDLNPRQAKQWITKYYGSLPPGNGLDRPARWTPRLIAPKLVQVEDRIPLERTIVGWPTPGTFENGDSALEIAAFLLNDGGQRLNAALTRGENLCSDLQIDTYRLQDASMFLVIGAPKPGVPVSKVEQVVTDEIARLARDGPTDEELARAKNNLEFRQLSSLENLQGIATVLNRITLFYGDPDHFAEWAGRYSKVTAQDVREAVGNWLDTPNRLVVRFHPIADTRAATPEPDRSQPPPFQAEKPYHPPEVKSSTLPNGLQIFVVERRDLPKVSMRLRFRLGVAHNPAGKEGLALVTLGSAKRGTRTRSGAQIEREVTDMATSIQAAADADSMSTGFDVLKKHLDPALGVLTDIVLNPAYSQGTFEAEKKEWLERLGQMESRPDDFGGAAMSIMLGHSHPLARSFFGTRKSVESLTERDAEEFHRRYWKPDVAALFFAGDVTLEEAVELSKKHFGSWTGTSAKIPPAPAPQPARGRLFVIDRKNSPQTLIVQMVPGIVRPSPEYPAMALADKVWGGMFSSRLMQNIRQDKGYAYEAGSEIWSYRSFGFWLAKSPVQTDKTAEALAEFVKELRGLSGEKPITPEELETAKAAIIRGYPGQFERTSTIADQISRHWASGLPMSDIRRWPEVIASTSLESVNNIARKYARPQKQVYLLIGDKAKIESGLKKLDLGEIVVLNQDGSTVEAP